MTDTTTTTTERTCVITTGQHPDYSPVSDTLDTTRTSGERCYENSPDRGWICTQVKGHDGDHVARDSMHRLCEAWKYVDEPTEPTEQMHPQSTVDELNSIIGTLRRENEAQRQRIADISRNYEHDINVIADALLEEAEDRNWCSEYDKFADRVNRDLRGGGELKVRHQEHDVHVTFEITVSKTVTVRTGDEPTDEWEPDTSEIEMALRRQFGYDVTFDVNHMKTDSQLSEG